MIELERGLPPLPEAYRTHEILIEKIFGPRRASGALLDVHEEHVGKSSILPNSRSEGRGSRHHRTQPLRKLGQKALEIVADAGINEKRRLRRSGAPPCRR